MTAWGWLALAAAIVVCAPAGVAGRRAAVLAGMGRLTGPGEGPPADEVAAELPGGERGGDAELSDGARAVVPHAMPGRGPAAVATLGLIAGGAWVGGAWLAAAGVALSAAGWVLLRDVAARRRATVRHTGLLAAVRVIVAELEAGARPAAALAAGAQAAPGHADVLRAGSAAAARGDDVAAVLTGDPDARVIGLAWRLGEDIGAAPAGVLGRVAADLGAAVEQRRAVAVALAGPRASAALLAGLPLVGIAMGMAMGARPLQFLAAPGGRVVCCIGVVLDVAGVLWMLRILRRAERS